VLFENSVKEDQSRYNLASSRLKCHFFLKGGRLLFSYRIDDELELRLIEERHAQARYDLIDRNREYLQQWLGMLPQIKSVEESRESIRAGLEGFAKGEALPSGMWYKGEYVGSMSLVHINQWHRSCDVGYWITEEMQGKGIVTRSCKALVDYALGELGLNRVEIFVAEGNIKSRAIPERLGFVQEAVLREAHRQGDIYFDMVLYTMLAREWKNRSW
jgi:ribosomal-protein-serine acetyltransferase